MGSVTVIVLVLLMTASGALDVWRITTGQLRQQVFTAEDIQFAQKVSANVPPACRILHAPKVNHAIMLTGRRLICGYGGHLWSHGFDYAEREADVKKIYAGEPQADNLLARYEVQYIVVGPPERTELGTPINETYLQQFPLIVATENYRLLAVPVLKK